MLIGDDQIKAEIPPPSKTARQRVLARIQALTPFDPAKQRLVLINPNASELLPHRRWMLERYAELIGGILATYPDVIVLITGAPKERATAEELASANARRAVSFAGQSSLAELPALLCRSYADDQQ